MINSTMKTIALSGFVALAATTVSASSLTINSVSGVWQNAVDVDGNAVNGNGSDTISWGGSFQGGGQSSYNFTGAGGGSTQDANTNFSLGTFTHNNIPVFPPSLDTADLLVTIDVEGFGAIDTLFSFNHTETPNNANPCALAGANDQGVNINGCADQAEATLNFGSSDTFMIGDTEFVFNVSGFEVDGSLFDSFLTIENQSNSAGLIGSFVAADTVAPVPLPAAGWMLLAGFGGLTAMRRRKKA